MAVFEENSNRTETRVYPYDLDLRDFTGEAICFFLDRYRWIKGNLILGDTNVDALPDGLFIEGNLYLTGSCIERLPKNLTVCGDLFLVHVYSIHEFPEDLSVGGNLYVFNSSLNGQKLPDSTSIGGRVVIDNNYCRTGDDKS